jgi:hypothetical protein
MARHAPRSWRQMKSNALLLLSVAAVVACGSSDGQDLFGSDAGHGTDSSGSGGSGPSGGTSGAGGTGLSASGGSAPDGNAGNDAGGRGGLAGGESDSGAAGAMGGSAGAPGSGGTGGNSTGGTGGAPSQVICGGATCTTDATHACCLDSGSSGFGGSSSFGGFGGSSFGGFGGSGGSGGSGGENGQCRTVDQAGCGASQATVRCDGPEDCAGSVCCGKFTSTFGRISYTELACVDASLCTGSDRSLLCDSSASNPCPAGGFCGQTSALPAGYEVCR